MIQGMEDPGDTVGCLDKSDADQAGTEDRIEIQKKSFGEGIFERIDGMKADGPTLFFIDRMIDIKTVRALAEHRDHDPFKGKS